MHQLDLTLPSPVENLACEEALLDAAESGNGGEVLRFWESPEPFVVVGYANKVVTEVNVAACEAQGVPILRRCSGGGTVLQGAGCLNYALILQFTESGPLRSITAANQFIMERNRAAIEGLFPRLHPGMPGPQVAISGHTDLTLDGLKFSGNSQRRKRQFLLFHGTVLIHFDLPRVSELLRMPSLEPEYRAHRSHDNFLVNLPLPAEKIKAALIQAWEARDELKTYPKTETGCLVAEKYSTKEWNWKF